MCDTLHPNRPISNQGHRTIVVANPRRSDTSLLGRFHFFRLWTTLSGFESLPPSQPSPSLTSLTASVGCSAALQARGDTAVARRRRARIPPSQPRSRPIVPDTWRAARFALIELPQCGSSSGWTQFLLFRPSTFYFRFSASITVSKPLRQWDCRLVQCAMTALAGVA